ncbi:MAG: response regulator transcription factor [Actinomycetota bacterium]|nr:response regulator transcription factor [Actinomycetota bacterium]
MTIRVLLADDQPLVRTGFRVLLDAEPGLEVVGTAEDGFQAVDLARRTHPHVAVLDVRMPGLDGIGAAERMLALPEPPRVLMLTTFDLDEHVFAALRVGASGFLLKDAPTHQLVDAVRVVAGGDALLAPAVTRRLIARFARHPPPPSEGIPAAFRELTPRELEVLGLIARGHSNAEIAATLVVSEATVKSHVNRLLAKLGLRDRVQAVVAAYEHGLVVPGDATAR